MHLVNFHESQAIHIGIVIDNEVADLTAAAKNCKGGALNIFDSAEAFIAAGDYGKRIAAELAETAPRKNLEELTFAPVVTAPEKIFCIGLNYLSHASEENETLPVVPEVFSKFNTALAAHNEAIPLPVAGGQFDYEAELVVVIGKQAKNVSRAQALEYVYGYTVGNDVSAREQQFRVSQWLIGKTADKFGPVGPFIVTRDAIDGANLNMRLWHNGELRQSTNTRELIFDVPTLVSYISQFVTLKPGDLIFTGTCAGVINGMSLPPEQRPWLKPGDEVIVEIEGIGKLRNIFAPDASAAAAEQ